MRVLTEAEFQSEAEPLVRQVFINDDSFGQPFAPNVPVRIIIYEYFYCIEPPLLDAVVVAASSLGDQGFYFSSLWRPREKVTNDPYPYHWYIPWADVSHYRDGSDIFGAIISASVLYSPQGKWGIMTSHEHYGLLGGTQEFVDGVRQLVPDLDEQIYGFLEYWQNCKTYYKGAKTDWIPGLLTQVYGEQTAQKLLQSANLP